MAETKNFSFFSPITQIVLLHQCTAQDWMRKLKVTAAVPGVVSGVKAMFYGSDLLAIL